MIAKINLLGEKRRGESRKRKQHKTATVYNTTKPAT